MHVGVMFLAGSVQSIISPIQTYSLFCQNPTSGIFWKLNLSRRKSGNEIPRMPSYDKKLQFFAYEAIAVRHHVMLPVLQTTLSSAYLLPSW